MPTKATQSPGTGKSLLIVESPSKVKTIAGYLGDAYEVESSMGHIRDLPQPSELPAELKKGPYGKFAVDVEHGFEPYYVVNPDKKKKVTELKRKLKEADALYLATDGDREGEAIAWHLLEVLKPKVPVYRLTFPEITREAIERAFGELRELDQDLVDAQETRRILDRLYGYEISPVLWRKIASGLSAGRVQSVATRLVVERERQRMAFVPADYWDLSGTFARTDGEDAGTAFSARLSSVDGKRVAGGRDFGDDGALKGAAGKLVHLDETAARDLAAGLEDAAFAVRSLETKPYTRRPAAPFTTSTLQQEAARKLRFTSRTTMQVAQKLYENGYITYMRTDSVALSDQAVSAARRQAAELYGSDAVPGSPRVYSSKSKNAQEAHEAVRPAGDSFRTPNQVRGELSADAYRLYELIWKRTVASQMADAKGSTATVRLGATSSSGRDAEFSASGTVITFRGFLAAYEEGRDEEPAEGKDGDKRLPRMAEGDRLEATDVAADGHRTSPPPRYTEASLVKVLDELGIGRPSTYAAVISTIMDRGYVRVRGSALIPSWTAFSVVRLLEEHFSDYVDYDFTAEMEEGLDRIARGEEDSTDWLQDFYFGSQEHENGLKPIVDDLGEIDARAVNSIPVTDTITLRVGKFGPYLEVAGAVDPGTGEITEPIRANVPEDLAPDELTPEKARELIETGKADGRELGRDPGTGRAIIAKDGRYGPYVTEVIPEPTAEELAAQPVEYYKNGKPKPPKKPVKEKPRTGSLLSSMTLQDVTLEDALKILSLPRTLGTDAEGNEITVQNGRFGPYLKKGSDSRSLQSEEQLFTITLEEALQIYAQPKQRGRGTAKPPLADLGTDQITERPMVIKDGRFGPYITDGETNVTVPRGETVEQITPARASQLLAEKRAQGPAPKRAARSTAKAPAKSTAGKSAAGKSAAGKSAAGKSPAAKSGTRKSTAGKPATGRPARAGTKG
ncbi:MULTISPECIES: type I DNA topoisomerase [unclassified Kocuria]|uniref:type I DNA topoisomerase n=1 Tax=unclassified Kocuria TaxID=2649579 RepID=UPI00064A8DE0|nr:MULTISPECIES: type I DNA topoisomerase [unclassified Kocuria]KLU08567.1 DNA topoisomerase I [Kocuria sp. SM24M-10]OLT06652.1 DNA topoisomerase I [Kocuria sp. CNJ-770]